MRFRLPCLIALCCALALATGCATPTRNTGASAQPQAAQQAGAPSGITANDLPAEASMASETDPIALPAETVLSDAEVETLGADCFFAVVPIPDAVFARMEGVTLPDDCPVARDDLRYVRVLHVDAEGQVKTGEMVANAAIADDLCAIFRKLYEERYPIERMRLPDDYDGDDEASMRANNTSCFNCRPIEGSGAQSRHSYGMAVDINPLYNPYVAQSGAIVLPETAREYADRSIATPYTIDSADLCCQLFALHGYAWGGDWTTLKDYQHFEK